MIRHALSVLVLMAVTAPGLAMAEKFDLICSGTGADTRNQNSTRPWERRIKVDLAQGAWCFGKCDAPEAIFRVLPNKYTFRWSHTGIRTDTFIVDRGDSTFQYVLIDGATNSGELVNGTCRCAPFSGLPKPRL
jgi:hypothetical protein